MHELSGGWSRRGGRVSLHRSAHQLKAERSNRMEGEALRRRVRTIESTAQRYSNGVFREKKVVTRQMENTRQNTGHCAASLRPESAKDMTRLMESPWFREANGRISERDLRRWRTTEEELSRVCGNGFLTRHQELSHAEKNRRLALMELLRTAGLLDKKTSSTLLPHPDFLPTLRDSECDKTEVGDTERSQDIASDGGLSEPSYSAKLRAQFPRAFAYCCETASAPSRLTSAASSSRGLERAMSRLYMGPHHSASSTSLPSRRCSTTAEVMEPRRGGSVVSHRRKLRSAASQITEEEEAVEEERDELFSRTETMLEEEQEEEEEEKPSGFAALPKWKRDLMIEAPLYGSEGHAADGVKLVVSKSHLRRELEEMKVQNMRRARLLHASNRKKVFL